jgi:hypothetical protein
MECQLIAENSRPGPALRSFLGELMIAMSGLQWLWRILAPRQASPSAQLRQGVNQLVTELDNGMDGWSN